MRITIETENEPQASKTVVLPADVQASGGAAPARTVVTQALSSNGEPMHLNGGRAPSLTALARGAGASQPRFEQERQGAAVTDAGAAPQALKHAKAASAEQHKVDEPKVTRKQK
jgi:hypothetical protein